MFRTTYLGSCICVFVESWGTVNEQMSLGPPAYPSRSPGRQMDPNATEVTTLDHLTGAFSFCIGPTGTADLSLLSRQAYDARSNAKHVATGLSFRKVADDLQGNSTVFGITKHLLIDNAEPRASKEQSKQAWTELWEIVERKTALQLCRLYFKFVNPYFPVMSSAACPDSIGTFLKDQSCPPYGHARDCAAIYMTACSALWFPENFADMLIQLGASTLW